MTSIQELHKQSQSIYAFVYKYFEKLSPEMFADLSYDFVLSPLEVYQQILKINDLLPELFKSTSEEKDVMDLWAHKEMVLQTLVVLTNIGVMAEFLEHQGVLNEAASIRNKLIDDFTQKVVEDPNVLYAIQEGTIDEEIQRRKDARELYNFKPLFEQHRSLVIEAEGVNFTEIPEKF